MSFEPWYLFFSMAFGLVGMAAFRFGYQRASLRHLALAVALMIVPYFVTEAGPLCAVGVGLTFLLFWP
jgi:hypothetical protein